MLKIKDRSICILLKMPHKSEMMFLKILPFSIRMKKYLLALVCSTILLLLTHCSNKPHLNYDQIGKKLCSCSEELSQKNTKLTQLIEKKQNDKAMLLMDTLETMENKLKACIIEENKLDNFMNDSKSEKALPRVLNKLCPDRSGKIIELVKEIK